MRSKNGGDGGTGVYMREGTTSRVTAANRTYSKFYDFYSASPKNFGSNHVYRISCIDRFLYVWKCILNLRILAYSHTLHVWDCACIPELPWESQDQCSESKISVYTCIYSRCSGSRNSFN
jgi:hypothetical protein